MRTHIPTILLIGHRGSGKSTLGARLAASLQLRFSDLDTCIEQREGRSAAELVGDDEERFRRLEVEMLAELLGGDGPSVIATGGGLRAFPSSALIVHIDREGWEDSARDERARLRPEMSFDEEITWMRATREPVYRSVAHLRVAIGRGTSVEDADTLLRAWIELALDAIGSPVMARTWMVVPSEPLLQRCTADAHLFGLAGLELRSDLFPVPPTVACPALVSLRTEDPGYFAAAPGAAMYDCVARFIEHALLDGLDPRPLIVSTHPNDVDQESFDAMVAAGEALVTRYPAWRPFLRYKYAPRVKSWIEQRTAHELCRVFLRRGGRVSLLPQGKAGNWMRAFRVWSLNELNYVWPGALPEGAQPPGLVYFIPHAAGPAPDYICGIIGDPVEHSIGDMWHRHLARIDDSAKLGYIKIPVHESELEHALYFLLKLDLLGLSVTSPHKASVIRSNFVTSPDGTDIGNTLTLRDGGWLLTDTDRDGMRATLEELRRRGIEPGPAAIFGRGGVIPALRDTLESDGWRPVVTVAARDGWGALSGDTIRLVVNAGRPQATPHEAPPRSEAWVDLAYLGIARLPDNVRVYLNGGTFYMAQAAAQRAIWCAEAALRDGRK